MCTHCSLLFAAPASLSGDSDTEPALTLRQYAGDVIWIAPGWGHRATSTCAWPVSHWVTWIQPAHMDERTLYNFAAGAVKEAGSHPNPKGFSKPLMVKLVRALTGELPSVGAGELPYVGASSSSSSAPVPAEGGEEEEGRHTRAASRKRALANGE